VVALGTAAHNKAALMEDLLPQLLPPLLYDQMRKRWEPPLRIHFCASLPSYVQFQGDISPYSRSPFLSGFPGSCHGCGCGHAILPMLPGHDRDTLLRWGVANMLAALRVQ